MSLMRDITIEDRERIRQSDIYKVTKPLLDKPITNILKLTDKIGWQPTAYQIFESNCVDFHKKWLEGVSVANILRGLKMEVVYPTPKHQAMSKMLAFMGLVESLGVTMSDMLLILAIANGKEVHTRDRYIRHVRTFKELAKVDWEYKRFFLVNEGFEIVNSILNLNIRNRIAHLHFKISENGEIKETKGNNPIDIDLEINNFWVAIDTLFILFLDLGLLNWLDETEKNHVNLQS
jgi:hypothetical protein